MIKRWGMGKEEGKKWEEKKGEEWMGKGRKRGKVWGRGKGRKGIGKGNEEDGKEDQREGNGGLEGRRVQTEGSYVKGRVSENRV